MSGAGRGVGLTTRIGPGSFISGTFGLCSVVFSISIGAISCFGVTSCACSVSSWIFGGTESERGAIWGCSVGLVAFSGITWTLGYKFGAGFDSGEGGFAMFCSFKWFLVFVGLVSGGGGGGGVSWASDGAGISGFGGVVKVGLVLNVLPP